MVARYFDHAATTPCDARVREEMLPYLGEKFGNPSSLHSAGQQARAAVELARFQLSLLLGVEPEEILFTSGATESANAVIAAYEDIAISPFEHSAVREPALLRKATIYSNQGYELLDSIRPPKLSCVMSVNNETGAFIREPNDSRVRTLIDATQAIGKGLPIELGDYTIGSAHKFGGPQGVGFLVAKNGGFPPTLAKGGDQEFGYRGGTLNVAGIVGLGAAATIARLEADERLDQVEVLRDLLLNELDELEDWHTNDHPDGQTSPYILSLSFSRVEGETVVIEADAAGFAISAGAACSARSDEPSHVLTALDLPEDERRGTIRVSFGTGNTEESTAALGQTLVSIVKRLRQMA